MVKKRVGLILLVLLTAVVLLNIPSVRKSSWLDRSRTLAANVFYPFQFVFYKTASTLGRSFNALVTLRNAQIENSQLSLKLAQAALKLNMYQEIEKENQTLKVLLDYKNQSSFKRKLVLAEVIARSPERWFDMLEINAGANAGLKEGGAVVSAKGAVGRIYSVAKWSAKVLLLSDQDSAVSGVDAQTREIGLVVGGNQDFLRMRYVPISADIKSGNLILTSGMNEGFPKGIPLGRVSKVTKKDYDLFQYIEIRPAVDFSRLTWVFVIK